MEHDAHGRFQWNELLTHDLEAARAFYTPIMGWEYDNMKGPDGPYLVAIKKNMPVCGIAPFPKGSMSEQTPLWLSYIEVDKIDEAVSKAKAAGATVIRAPIDIPEVGRIAVIQDVVGALVGLMTPDFDD